MKLKTRTNQPVYYKLPVSSNIQSLSDDLLNSLRVGDVVQKKTGNQKHCYIVTYKEEKKGICLTYTDASSVETISYDYTGGHWVFNSKDVTSLENIAYTTGANFSGAITSPSIIEDMSGYSASLRTFTGWSIESIYTGACKNGNKLTIVSALRITMTDSDTASSSINPVLFNIPLDVANKIIPEQDVFTPSENICDIVEVKVYGTGANGNVSAQVRKTGSTQLAIYLIDLKSKVTVNNKNFIRVEATFLLNDSLIPSGE